MIILLELRLYPTQAREFATLILDIWYSIVRSYHTSARCLARYLAHIISCLAPFGYFHIHSFSFFILSKIATLHFLIIWIYLENLTFLIKILPIFPKSSKFWTKTSKFPQILKLSKNAVYWLHVILLSITWPSFSFVGHFELELFSFL